MFHASKKRAIAALREEILRQIETMLALNYDELVDTLLAELEIEVEWDIEE